MCVSVRIYTYIFQLSPMTEPKSNKMPDLMSTPGTQILVSNHCSPMEGTRAPWRSGWLTPGLEQEKNKMELEHLVGSENKEVLQKGWRHIKSTQKLNRKISQWPKLKQFKKQINDSSGRNGLQHLEQNKYLWILTIMNKSLHV